MPRSGLWSLAAVTTPEIRPSLAATLAGSASDWKLPVPALASPRAVAIEPAVAAGLLVLITVRVGAASAGVRRVTAASGCSRVCEIWTLADLARWAAPPYHCGRYRAASWQLA